MDFKKLVNILEKQYHLSHVVTALSLPINDVALLDPMSAFFSPEILYFGYEKQLPSLSHLPAQCILVPISGEEAKLTENVQKISGESSPEAMTKNDIKKAAKKVPQNVAYVEETLLFSVFNASKQLIEDSREDTLYGELTALADKTGSIDAVIDAASIKLGQSLLFCDQTFKIVSSSQSIPVTDELWRENIRQGYCNYDFIRDVKSLSAVSAVKQDSKSALEVTCMLSPYRKLSCKVFDNGRQIGFLLLIEEREKTSPEALNEALPIVSRAVSYTVSHYIPDLSEVNDPHQQILYDFLIGAPKEAILPRLATNHFPPHIVVLFLASPQYPRNWFQKKETATHLKLKLPGSHITYHEHGIVAVVPLKDTQTINANFLSILKKFSIVEKTAIGISNDFHHIEEFELHYKQAHQSYSLGRKFHPKATVYSYTDYTFFDMLSQISSEEALARFLHPCIHLLQEYDMRKKTELLETLKTYLENDCNLKDTAASLYIHRNSLSYRMNRILNLTHLDLEDAHTKFLLRISFFIMDYQGGDKFY